MIYRNFEVKKILWEIKVEWF